MGQLSVDPLAAGPRPWPPGRPQALGSGLEPRGRHPASAEQTRRGAGESAGPHGERAGAGAGSLCRDEAGQPEARRSFWGRAGALHGPGAPLAAPLASPCFGARQVRLRGGAPLLWPVSPATATTISSWPQGQSRRAPRSRWTSGGVPHLRQHRVAHRSHKGRSSLDLASLCPPNGLLLWRAWRDMGTDSRWHICRQKEV